MQSLHSILTRDTCSNNLDDYDLIHINHGNEREIVVLTQARGCGSKLWVGHRVDLIREQASELLERVKLDTNWAVFHLQERIVACNLAQVRCITKIQIENTIKVTLYLSEHDTCVEFPVGSDEPTALIDKYRATMTKLDSRIQERKNALFEVGNGHLVIGVPLCSALVPRQSHVFLYCRSKIGNGHSIPCENDNALTEVMNKLSSTWQRRENVTISHQATPVVYVNSRFPDREFRDALD